MAPVLERVEGVMERIVRGGKWRAVWLVELVKLPPRARDANGPSNCDLRRSPPGYNW